MNLKEQPIAGTPTPHTHTHRLVAHVIRPTRGHGAAPGCHLPGERAVAEAIRRAASASTPEESPRPAEPYRTLGCPSRCLVVRSCSGGAAGNPHNEMPASVANLAAALFLLCPNQQVSLAFLLFCTSSLPPRLRFFCVATELLFAASCSLRHRHHNTFLRRKRATSKALNQHSAEIPECGKLSVPEAQSVRPQADAICRASCGCASTPSAAGTHAAVGQGDAQQVFGTPPLSAAVGPQQKKRAHGRHGLCERLHLLGLEVSMDVEAVSARLMDPHVSLVAAAAQPRVALPHAGCARPLQVLGRTLPPV
jgi:hypothetical protein